MNKALIRLDATQMQDYGSALLHLGWKPNGTFVELRVGTAILYAAVAFALYTVMTK